MQPTNPAQRLKRSRRRDLLGVKNALSRAWTGFARAQSAGNSLAKACAGKTGLRLNVGCGPLTRDGWINMDFNGDGRSTHFFDARDPLPIASGSVSHIHTEHFLEHVEYDEAQRFLAECARVLEPGGTIRVILPDLEIYVRAYTAGDKAFFDRMADLGGRDPPMETPAQVINQMARMWGDHRYAWDFQTLRLEMSRAGFEQIERSTVGAQPQDLDLDGRDDWRLAESLYVNARRAP